jgi:hypothetical protein
LPCFWWLWELVPGLALSWMLLGVCVGPIWVDKPIAYLSSPVSPSALILTLMSTPRVGKKGPRTPCCTESCPGEMQVEVLFPRGTVLRAGGNFKRRSLVGEDWVTEGITLRGDYCSSVKWLRSLGNMFVTKKVGCYKMSPPHVFGLFQTHSLLSHASVPWCHLLCYDTA